MGNQRKETAVQQFSNNQQWQGPQTLPAARKPEVPACSVSESVVWKQHLHPSFVTVGCSCGEERCIRIDWRRV